MPPKSRSGDAAEALVAVGPLVSRWIERLLAAHHPPLTVAQFLALRAIATETISGSELAERAGVSRPAVSQLLAGLSDSGLIERRELAQDRRRNILTLSPRGRPALASAQLLLRDRISSLLADLPRPEVDALARALPQLEAALAGTAPPRRPPPPPPARRPAGHDLPDST